ncbi:MAG TPA: HAD family phosphatase [Gemmataceae bacterium]|jgi:HAD superfamily hydrolase (TIGR01509 family)|nr:HAD family phosphatase [Gemmataceae bacterium]
MPNKTTKQIRAVVFDLDGLMIDSEPIFEEAARRLLARRGRTLLPRVLQAMLGVPARDALKLFGEGHGLSETVEELRVESSRLFAEVVGETPVPLMPGVLELLERLEAKGIPKAIATSSSASYVQRILPPHNLLQRFQFVLTCDDVTCGKPAPEIYEKAAARWGYAPAEMLVLEDSPNGLRAAKAAGAICVVVPHALIPMDDLAGAAAILPSLLAPELLAMLGV